ncbi:collagen alpha-6(VI) chain-like isoform X2 [Magallana gigas]|uniref:collagen alpha-6(VI) chain-like isoform X2 n=1 Tax=Magallana gigas TaxID=29159 RepID=UPI003342D8BB
MSCFHSTPYAVNFIWIRSGWGSTGEWRFPNDVACKHVTNSDVSITTDDTSCNGRSYYACNSGYKQVAGNTQRTCGFGGILSGYPLVCSVSTCKIDIVLIVEASAYTSSIHSALMAAIGDLAGSLQISTSNILAGVIIYDDTVDLNIDLDDYYSASTLDSSITSIPISNAASAVNLAEALRVGFYDFFTLSKGNRFTAFRHFVVIAKTYSSQTGATVADQIRMNLRNQLFTVGISPSASLITDLKAIAGDDSRHFEVSSPDDLYTKFNNIFQKIAVCPDIIIEPMTVECELDIVFIVERYNLRYTKRFLAELMDNITISSTGIKVGMVLFDSGASTVFRLNSHTSSESVRDDIEKISETNHTDHLVDKGLIEARDNVFTAARGDRTDASNYYVIIVGPFESYPEAVAKDIRSSGSNYIFSIHIGNQYQTEYQKAVDTCGDYTKYTNVDSYENLINIKNDILQKITTCESVNITIPVESGTNNTRAEDESGTNNTRAEDVESGTNNTRAEDEQSPFLVPILSGGAVLIVVIIFAIILGKRRHLCQQQVNRSVYEEHRAPIPNKSEDHYTELDLTEAHQYIELDSVQADISTVTGQFASKSDNQYTEPHTIKQQLEIDRARLTPDHPYTALDTIQNTQTTNIPSGMQ